MFSVGFLAAIVVGFASGYLSGQLGVGGGILTTPAIRLVLGYPAYIAVGTPLVVIIPTTIAAAAQYAREQLVDWRLAAQVAPVGLAGVLAGAYLTRFVSGDWILIATAAVMMVVAARMARGRSAGSRNSSTDPRRDRQWLSCGVGLAAGFFSGFLGLGGGVILVPAFSVLFARGIKVALGTSLVTICAFAVPGAIVHWTLGHVDLRLAGLLILGVVPGARLGARVAIRAPEAVLRVAFALFLIVFAVIMGGSEIVRTL